MEMTIEQLAAFGDDGETLSRWARLSRWHRVAKLTWLTEGGGIGEDGFSGPCEKRRKGLQRTETMAELRMGMGS
jgi:hypothetical protein